MAETIQEKDFIELDYTGKLTDGKIFDTTIEDVAKENGLDNKNSKYGSIKICVGEKQLLPGLDKQLIGKELNKEYEIKLAPEDAFGKRDIKKVQIVPLSTFVKHKVQPQPGLQIDVDGQMGIVKSVSGGRVIVNFNHPLSGREVIYVIKATKKITDNSEKIKSYLNIGLRFPEENIKVELKENNALVELPMQLPEQFTAELGKKLVELTKLKEVKFTAPKQEKEVAKLAESFEEKKAEEKVEDKKE